MLRSLQKKPAHARAHIAFMIAFVLSVVVMGFWVVTLPTKFAQIREVNEQAAAVRDAANDAENARSNQAAAAILNEFVASTTEVYRDLSTQLKDISGTPPQTRAPEDHGAERNKQEESDIIIRETN